MNETLIRGWAARAGAENLTKEIRSIYSDTRTQVESTLMIDYLRMGFSFDEAKKKTLEVINGIDWSS